MPHIFASLLSQGASLLMLLSPNVLSTIVACYLVIVGTLAIFGVADLVAEPEAKDSETVIPPSTGTAISLKRVYTPPG